MQLDPPMADHSLLQRLKLSSQELRSCQASKKLFPRAPTSPRGYKQSLMLPWYIIWSMFKKPPNTLVRHQKGDMMHFLRQTASATTKSIRVLVSTYSWNPRHRRGEGKCFREAHRRQVACHYLEGGVRICRP